MTRPGRAQPLLEEPGLREYRRNMRLKTRYQLALDSLNFFLADVRGGLGPYVSVFLLTEAHWDQATIGAVLTISGIIGITLHTPIGALIDATRHKRGLLVAGVALFTASAIGIAQAPTLPVVLAADIVMAVAGAIFAPTVAAITLGLVLRSELPLRLGRNAAFDRAGNLFIAGMAGLVGWWVGQRAVFYLVPFFAVFFALALSAIPAHAINHERARGLDHADAASRAAPLRWRVLVESKALLILAGGIALFHFANAPMLPMLGQKLALAHKGEETLLMSAAIATAQLTMIPTALLVGRLAGRLDHKSLLLVAFAALPLRGVLLTLSDDRGYLIAVQVLDGIAAGAMDALLPLVLADIMGGTGRYNLGRGFVGTIQGIGGSLSNVVAGAIVVWAGYSPAFLLLGLVAAAAFLVILIGMPDIRSTPPPN
jgi:MFS family permease